MDTAEEIEKLDELKDLSRELLFKAKKQGFSTSKLRESDIWIECKDIEEAQKSVRKDEKSAWHTSVVRS